MEKSYRDPIVTENRDLYFKIQAASSVGQKNKYKRNVCGENKKNIKLILFPLSSGETTFPGITICPAYEKAFKTEILSKFIKDTQYTAMDMFRREFDYPNVTNLSGWSKKLNQRARPQ